MHVRHGSRGGIDRSVGRSCEPITSLLAPRLSNQRINVLVVRTSEHRQNEGTPEAPRCSKNGNGVSSA
jgi:hypothetical protein